MNAHIKVGIEHHVAKIMAAASQCEDGIILVMPRSYLIASMEPVTSVAGVPVYLWPSKSKAKPRNKKKGKWP